MINNSKLFSLDNQISVVTGGTGYLGKEITKGLAEFGSKVFILDINQKSANGLLNSLPKNLHVEFIECDISSKSEIDRCFEMIYNKWKKIDILVNNAYYGKGDDLECISEENWNSGIDGTINNYFRCLQSVIKYMKASGGNIINIASMYGVVSPDPSIYGNSGFNNPPNYGAGKAAVIQLTKYAAVHLAKYNIRVNAISPGPFPNSQVQKNRDFIRLLEEKVPLKRIGKPEELKGIIVFLASKASSYITGQNISVDGGWTSW